MQCQKQPTDNTSLPQPDQSRMRKDDAILGLGVGNDTAVCVSYAVCTNEEQHRHSYYILLRANT